MPSLPPCASTDCAPPADGASSLLATAGPLLDAAGKQLPDGTLVTVAATGGAAVLAADADPATPGWQVRVLDGRIDFAFRAPPASAIDPTSKLALVTVTATVAGSQSCAAAVVCLAS